MKLPPLFLLLFLLCLVTLVIPSCADFPIQARLVGPNGSIGYSSKAGLTVDVDARTGK